MNKLRSKARLAFEYFKFFCMLFACGFSMERLHHHLMKNTITYDIENNCPFKKTGRYKI